MWWIGSVEIRRPLRMVYFTETSYTEMKKEVYWGVKKMQKKIGIGSSSIILLVLGMLWCTTFKEVSLGDIILNALNLKAWTKGTTGFHVGILYSLIFLIPAWVVASKYIDDWGTRVVRIASFFLIAFVSIGGISYILSRYF